MPVVFRIAIRNLREHKSKTLIIGIIIGVGIAVVIAGNSLAETAAKGLRASFIDNFTGNIMISGKTEKQLSIFGYPPGNANEEIPRISSYEKVYEYVQGLPDVEVITPQLSGFALITVDERQDDEFFSLLFGVDAEGYRGMFPESIEILEGKGLSDGEEGLLLPDNQIEEYEEQLGLDIKVGDPIQMTSFGGSGLRIRELPLTGIFRFRQKIEGLGNIAIMDAQSFRALDGLVVSTGQIELTEEETSMLVTDDFDSLFSDDAITDASEESEQTVTDSINEESVFGILGGMERAPTVTDSGAWHFLLVKLNAGVRSATSVEKTVIEDLNSFFDENEINAQAVDWREAAGGFSRLASVVQSVFNGAIVVIAIVAVIIIMNTLVISVIERTPEIGTMRALGAHKKFVRRMFLWETLTISWVFGILGIILGAIIVVALNLTGIRAGNDFLNILFGGEVLKPTLSGFSVLISLAIINFIGFVASIYPVRVALRVQPIRAVQAD